MYTVFEAKEVIITSNNKLHREVLAAPLALQHVMQVACNWRISTFLCRGSKTIDATEGFTIMKDYDIYLTEKDFPYNGSVFIEEVE